MQLSLLPALEASRFSRPAPVSIASRDVVGNVAPLSPMAPINRPTQAQVAYLKRLTRIKTDTQLVRFVVRKLGKDQLIDQPRIAKSVLTKADFAKVIDQEIAEKRWAL